MFTKPSNNSCQTWTRGNLRCVPSQRSWRLRFRRDLPRSPAPLCDTIVRRALHQTQTDHRRSILRSLSFPTPSPHFVSVRPLLFPLHSVERHALRTISFFFSRISSTVCSMASSIVMSTFPLVVIVVTSALLMRMVPMTFMICVLLLARMSDGSSTRHNLSSNSSRDDAVTPAPSNPPEQPAPLRSESPPSPQTQLPDRSVVGPSQSLQQTPDARARYMSSVADDLARTYMRIQSDASAQMEDPFVRPHPVDSQGESE